MNFGPLNRQGGERRLNVAITRARDRVKILASFQPSDIDLSRTSATGVVLLRQYLEFAVQGPSALLGEITSEGGDFESPFEEAVADALHKRGLRVVSQVGVSNFHIDLGIHADDSDRYLLGVECDGATYHSSQTARDRDRLRQEVLERLGWTIHRVWSTDWIKDPGREVDKIVEALERARSQPPVPEPHAPKPLTPEVAAVTSSHDEWSGLSSASSLPPSSPIAVPYRPVRLPRKNNSGGITGAPIDLLAEQVRKCVDVEGPVHEDRVMRAVADSWGQKAGSRIKEHLKMAIDFAVKRGWIARRGAFIWPPGMTTAPVRSGGPNGKRRPISEVAPEELSAALVASMRPYCSLEHESLITAVARELGYDHTGAHIKAALGSAISVLVASGVLIDTGGRLRLSDEHRDEHD